MATTYFRTINFTALLRETLTAFFSYNKAGQATWGYKFCAGCLSVFVQPWAAYDTFRQKQWLIANCKWQVGQLTNVLNSLYDSVLNRITVTQAAVTPEFLMQFGYPAEDFLGAFTDNPAAIFLQTFAGIAETVVSINVPAGIDLVDLTSTVAAIAIDGPPYQIVTV